MSIEFEFDQIHLKKVEEHAKRPEYLAEPTKNRFIGG